MYGNKTPTWKIFFIGLAIFYFLNPAGFTKSVAQINNNIQKELAKVK